MDHTYLQKIPLDAIIPDPKQPRNLLYSLEELIEKANAGDRHAKAIWDKLSELATSILEVGLQQPITVYPSGDDDKYIIHDGHRRWMATKFLSQQGHGNGTIECYVQPIPKSDYDALLGQLNINIQREGFNAFELARSLQQIHQKLQANGGMVRLVDEDGRIKTVELEPGQPGDIIWNVIEQKMGIGRSRRYQIQGVLKIPAHNQRLAEGLAIPESRLRYVIPLKDERIQEIIIREIAEKNLSNAEIKRRIKELQEEAVAPPAPAMPKPMQIRSAIKPVKRLVKEVEAIESVPAAISAKDPRTVAGYKELIPELRAAVKGLQAVLTKLDFLEAE